MWLQHRWPVVLVVLALGTALSGCGSGPSQPSGEGGHYKLGRPYQINGRWYEPFYDPSYEAEGIASWYGDPFHGRLTANGERYDKRRLSAAHTTLPLPSLVEVTNLENGRTLEARVNDRGPFAGDRIIDLSEAAAEALGFKEDGLTRVRVRFLGLADSKGTPPQPTVVARAEPALTRPPARATAAVPCDTYFLQVGAYADRAQAQATAAFLQGRFAAPVRGQSVREGGVTRVRLGPFSDLDVAHRALAQVARDGHGNAFIMQLNAPADQCGVGRA